MAGIPGRRLPVDKSLGQHFLRDPIVVSQILRVLNPQTDDCFLEIGPGIGALSIPLQDYPVKLAVVELDRDLVSLLQRHLPAENIFQMDILQFDIDRLPWHDDIRVFGNLPYNIGTPILFHLHTWRERIRDMVFMLQKEVVDRIVAAPGTSARGRLSVMCQTMYDPQFLFSVPPAAFHPPPRVHSAMLSLRPAIERVQSVLDWQHYSILVRQAFSSPRKMLRNTLCFLNQGMEPIPGVDVDPTARAADLSVNDFIALSNFLSVKEDKNQQSG